jgi:hypothetical protein
MHQDEIKYCADNAPTQQAEKEWKQNKLLMPRLLGHHKILHTHHLARSSRHHSQQPHKEPTSQPWSYLSTCQSTHEKKTYMQLDPQQKSYRWHETLNTTPTNIRAKLLVPPVAYRRLPPKYIKHWKAFSIFILDVVCLCIRCGLQNTKHHPFLIHAGNIYTLPAFFFFYFSKIALLMSSQSTA